MDCKEAADTLREASRETIDSSKPVEVPDLAIGTGWAQGDLLIQRIARLPKSMGLREPRGLGQGQLAPGNTRGSQHIIAAEDLDHCTIWEISDGDDLSNLLVVAEKPWKLTHPEHAHCTFPAGTYRVHHQQNEQRQRVLD